MKPKSSKPLKPSAGRVKEDTRILNFCPPGQSPRPIQTAVLQQIEAQWDSADVFVLQLPVASGKSMIAMTIARWAQAKRKQRSTIITPTNVLVEQYTSTYKSLFTLKKKDSYTCINTEEDTKLAHSCATTHAVNKQFCPGCPYINAIRQSKHVSVGIYNYWTFLAHRLHTDVLIADEAHNLIQVIREQTARKLWKHEYHYPNWVTSYATLLKWASSAIAEFPNDKKLSKLVEDLESGKLRTLASRTMELYHGKEMECIKLIPIDVKNEKAIFWGSKKVQKVILMSGTFSFKDVEALGLDKKRIVYIDAPSSIPTERRPVHFHPEFSMAYAAQDKSLPLLVEYIDRVLQAEDGKGLVHATYSVADRLKAMGLGNHPRILFHTKENKMQVYKEFRDSPPDEGKVLVACGLYEGVDLPYDAGRWQIISKVPYPSLAEPALKFKAEEDPAYYAWETIKIVLQACGRISRTPTDFGRTYIPDKSFNRVYSEWPQFWPHWFKEGLLYE